MKSKHINHESREKSAEKVRALLLLHYEPGRQDRCKLAVYRNYIKKETGISESTFFRYLKKIEPDSKEDDQQLKLF